VRAVVGAMRPAQWVKNGFVMAPLIFAAQALDVGHVTRAVAAFGVFALLSGCVYLVNDLADVEADRRHPTKCRRPIASGALPEPLARRILAVGAVVAFTSAALLGPWPFVAVGASYALSNLAYSFSLKHIPFVDVGVIAAGFVLRLVAGALAVDVPLTGWIVVTTFSLAVFLALGKRRHELAQAGEAAERQRRVLTRYRVAHLDGVMRVAAVATVASYAGWTLFGGPSGRLFDPRDLVITIPSVIFGLYRFRALTARADDGASPTDRMLSDLPFILNVVLWCTAVALIIYWR
jgi:decaprenyl-phosphate phosphoribosyltransferase